MDGNAFNHKESLRHAESNTRVQNVTTIKQKQILCLVSVTCFIQFLIQMFSLRVKPIQQAISHFQIYIFDTYPLLQK